MARLLLRLTQFTLILAAAQHIAIAQPVSVGVRGGAHLMKWHTALNGVTNGVGTDESSRWAVGPFVSVALPARLALQAEALRRNYGFIRSASRPGAFASHEETGSAWELPLLLMWRPDYQENGWQPYIGAGPALRYVSANAVDIVRVPSGETSSPGRPATSHGGLVASAGMERRLGPVVVSTELRYAYWRAAKSFPEIYPSRNQVSILLGIRTR